MKRTIIKAIIILAIFLTPFPQKEINLEGIPNQIWSIPYDPHQWEQIRTDMQKECGDFGWGYAIQTLDDDLIEQLGYNQRVTFWKFRVKESWSWKPWIYHMWKAIFR